jgi:hypothetical protein
MSEPTPRPRWPRLTPASLVLLLLAVASLLWLSNWLAWPAWHKGYAVLSCVAAVGVVILVMLLWFLAALVFRWRFQFSIRTLLVLTVAVALSFSGLAVELKRAKEQQMIVAATKTLQEIVEYDWQVDANGNSLQAPLLPVPSWLSSLFGDDFFADVVSVCLSQSNVADEEVESLKRLTQLRFLYLFSPCVTDAGLENLRALPRLEILALRCPRVTDTGLEFLAEQTNLQELHLVDSHATNAGLDHIKRLKRLRVIESDSPGFPPQRSLNRVDPKQIVEALEAFDTAASDKSAKKVQQPSPAWKQSR